METLKILTLRKYFANYVGSLTTIFAGPQLERYLGGGCLFIYSPSARRISFEISCH